LTRGNENGEIYLGFEEGLPIFILFEDALSCIFEGHDRAFSEEELNEYQG
jgi:hypothetical protein